MFEEWWEDEELELTEEEKERYRREEQISRWERLSGFMAVAYLYASMVTHKLVKVYPDNLWVIWSARGVYLFAIGIVISLVVVFRLLWKDSMLKWKKK